MSLPTRFDLESQLFALIRTLGDLQKKVESGVFAFTFYRNKISEITNEILLIELIFKKKGFNLDKILDEMNISEDLFSIIPKIKNYILFRNIEMNEKRTNNEKLDHNLGKEKIDQIIGSYPGKRPIHDSNSDFKLLNFNFKEDDEYLINEIPVNPLKLAKMSADITSDLITIIDFIKLKMPKEISILFELGKRLYDNLKLFPGMEELAVELAVYLKEIGWMKIKENNSDSMDVIRNTDFIEVLNKKNNDTNKIKFNDLIKKFEIFFMGFKKNILIQSK